jgi:hypothetical protein
MADVLKYGWARGGRMGTNMPIDANISFHRKGGAFVNASGTTGMVQMVIASTAVIVGWAETPRAPVPGTADYWTSSSTAGKDSVLVIHDPTAIFAMPADETLACLSASLVGRFCAASAPQGRESTSLKQVATAKAATAVGTQQFFVTGVDVPEKIIYVRVNPHHLA